MTPLRQQMHDAMLVRGLAERTRQTYIENVARLAIFYHRNPADLTPSLFQYEMSLKEVALSNMK
jgi:hypothetical protein